MRIVWSASPSLWDSHSCTRSLRKLSWACGSRRANVVLRRPEIFSEVLDNRGRSEREVEEHRPLRRCDSFPFFLAFARQSPLPHCTGGGIPGGGGACFAVNANIFPTKPAQRPVRHCNESSRTKTATAPSATTLAAERTSRQTWRSPIEAAVRLRQLLHVSLDELNLQSFRLSAFASLIQEIRSEIQSSNFGAGFSSWYRRVARAASHIQNFHAMV